MKIDPYKHQEKYIHWKERTVHRIDGISKENSDLIKQYLSDMEKGINIASGSTKGSRSFTRLNSLRDKMIYFSKQFETIYHLTRVTEIDEEKIISFFSDMRNGIIRKKNGGVFQSVDTYARIFKSFWHWWQKVNKKQGKEISDITVDLDTRQEKPSWVYLTEQEVKKLCDYAKPDYRALILFLFDSGIRSPTELINVKVCDLYQQCKELHIREEISKTFGRRIKLMLCSEFLVNHIKEKNLSPEDYLFPINHFLVNKYLKRLAKRLFGDKISSAGAKYSDLTMYDFRHISCCYWLPRYKSESALKYRFGWKKSDKIHYYSELLGMKDTIAEEDLLIDTTKTEIEKRLIKTEKENDILKEKYSDLQEQVLKISKLLETYESKIN